MTYNKIECDLCGADINQVADSWRKLDVCQKCMDTLVRNYVKNGKQVTYTKDNIMRIVKTVGKGLYKRGEREYPGYEQYNQALEDITNDIQEYLDTVEENQ